MPRFARITSKLRTSHQSKRYNKLLQKSAFVSGRDSTAIEALASVLREDPNPLVRPENVQRIRDPVLSDKMLTDKEGTCWKQSEGAEYSLTLTVCLKINRTWADLSQFGPTPRTVNMKARMFLRQNSIACNA